MLRVSDCGGANKSSAGAVDGSKEKQSARHHISARPNCSLDKGVACTQHIQLPTHTSELYECTLTFAHVRQGM